jgi:nitrogen fixation protein FixH
MSDPVEGKPIDRWLPWLFVLFFVVVFAVNGVMVYVGATSWTGLETKHYYLKGIDYNETLDAVEHQKEMGWTADLSVDRKSENAVRLDFALQDRRHLAVGGADVTARLVRPTSEGHDMDVRLDDYGRGHYVADVVLPLRGQWDVRVVAKHPSGDFHLTRRIVVR